jgi:hypothetical protein
MTYECYIVRKRPQAVLTCYPEICLEEMSEICRDRPPSGRDSNQRPPEYEAGMLSAQPQCV